MSVVGSRVGRLPYGPAIVATFLVDIVDKVFADVLAIAPYGRCWFHTLLSVAVCSFLVGKWKGKEWGYSWMLGHFLHLIGDIGFIPWFYPFISYDWPDSPNIVAVSIQGVEETLAGMHYSEIVARVFIGKLMLVEFLLLASAAFMLSKWVTRRKPIYIALTVVFLLTASFRLMYDFPVLVESMTVWMGDWVRL